ncbi:DEAD/DEAH box helicase [Saccharopolyspora sp. K220]|uniref:DEAD/DEAH box helicase n=1 Tax=Saccharopolyspora soli TaxID=2926618 RepID=UPI001F55D927|nr:DEAD/DEAH box helicase [Saccharopolyspora soli]MCI2422989.1 DEAD/DEAH box helicase [Saccharopolyspora soli]
MQATFQPGDPLPSAGHLALWGTDDPATAANDLGFPLGQPGQLPTVLATGNRVGATDVPAVLIPIGHALAPLAALPTPDRWPNYRRPGDSLIAWSVAAKLALEHVSAGHLVPEMRTDVACWRLVNLHDGRLGALAEAMPPAAHALRRDAGLWTAAELLAAFGDAVADVCARGTAIVGGDSWGGKWVAALTGPEPSVRLDDQVKAELQVWAAPLPAGPVRPLGGQLRLRLEVPAEDDTPWEISFHLQAAGDPTVSVPAERAWSAGTATLQLPGCSIGAPQDSLVRGLAEAARIFPPLDAALSEQRPTGVRLDAAQAAEFLSTGEPELTAAGITVDVPTDLTGVRRLRARLRSLDASRFCWEAAIGDHALSAEELDELIASGRPLVRWHGQWVRVDAREARDVRAVLGKTQTLSQSEALAAVLEGRRATELGEVDVSAGGRLRALLERLGEPAREPQLVGIDATLRGYQQRGAAWLQSMADLGFGAVLADDMGLGKTLQTITLLAARGGDRPQLVVCPTSVVDNWERELNRFAPKLPVVRHHGPRRPTGPDAFAPGSVVITTYPLLRADVALLSEVDWDVVVLDEAQQIKNQAGQTAQAAGRLRAQARVALTGTPVENRLAELWSIMHFANPGLLGRFPRFKERFAVPIERWHDTDATRRLRSVVAPFLLRRLKAQVATDLPAKIESVVACALTDEQAQLYRKTVRDTFEDGLGTGIGRRGRILKLLTALKQICNHPSHFLGESGPLTGRSGKLTRATEMLSEVAAADDRALVFTQYRVMGELLAAHLAAELDLPAVPFLHGGVSSPRRQAMVDAFQHDDAAPPLLIISLKAGGTGLNLTRATHVVHYDRWWNPAVEDQATDRAHRIGQSRRVHVHKLVTHGTLEERIADLLERKRALADSVIGSGETWLAELTDAALRELVELSTEEGA